MKVKIYPSEPVGKITAPPSKSMAHRVLICAAFSKGESVISNVAYSQDILATIDCLKTLGAKIECQKDKVFVRGIEKIRKNISLDCSESGSTLRFLFFPAIIEENEVLFIGRGRLPQRPMGEYEKICSQQGIICQRNENEIRVNGRIKPGNFTIDGDVSSQYISGLLFTLPMLDSDSKIVIENKVESKPYIDMTIDALKKFSIEVEWQDKNIIFVKGNQEYKATNLSVEGDYSNAAFFCSLGENVEVDGLDKDSLQADKVFFDFYNRLKESYCEFNISDCPDLGPILFSVSALYNGGRFVGTKRLKIKESDRVESMKEELSKMGVSVVAGEDFVEIQKSNLHKPTQLLESHSDHRIAMALSVILTKVGGEINNAECVKKSMPDFFERLEDLKVRLEKNEVR